MFNPTSIAALIIAASFAGGLNIYATILTLGILTRFHLASLPPGLESLGHLWVLIACATLFTVEFVADKIPGLDLVWNAIHTLIRIPLAALLAYHASAQLSPQMQILATIIGASIALIAHSSKTAIRAAVTPSPEPLSNIALSSTEDVFAVLLTWIATQHPILAATTALAFLLVMLIAARKLTLAIKNRLKSLFASTQDKVI